MKRFPVSCARRHVPVLVLCALSLVFATRAGAQTFTSTLAPPASR